MLVVIKAGAGTPPGPERGVPVPFLGGTA